MQQAECCLAAIGDALGAYLEFQPSREPENYLREYKSGGPHTYLQGIGLTIQVWHLRLLRVC